MRVLIVMSAALLLVSGSATAAAGACCGEHKASASAACCKGKEGCCRHETAAAAIDVSKLPQVIPGTAWPEERAGRPRREFAKVLFREPVRIGDKVLMGAYVIEHDLDRMARGLPCTYIYAADDLRLPVVAFHCVHLDRKPSPTATVTLQRIPSSMTPMYRFVEYQFQESGDGHGVPDGR